MAVPRRLQEHAQVPGILGGRPHHKAIYSCVDIESDSSVPRHPHRLRAGALQCVSRYRSTSDTNCGIPPNHFHDTASSILSTTLLLRSQTFNLPLTTALRHHAQRMQRIRCSATDTFVDTNLGSFCARLTRPHTKGDYQRTRAVSSPYMPEYTPHDAVEAKL